MVLPSALINVSTLGDIQHERGDDEDEGLPMQQDALGPGRRLGLL